jgi:hypothetical protein
MYGHQSVNPEQIKNRKMSKLAKNKINRSQNNRKQTQIRK